MADSCCTYMHELDDVHRWLPSEILGDIGIVDHAECHRLAVVEDLAARLASVLGSAVVERTQNNSHQQRRHSRTADGPPFTSSSSSRPMLGQAVALPRFAPAPPAMRPPRPAFAACATPPLNRSGNGGTGVFLPRTEAYRGAGATARLASGDDDAGVKQTPPHHGRRQQQCRSSKRHVGAATRSRMQLHHLHAHDAAPTATAEQPART